MEKDKINKNQNYEKEKIIDEVLNDKLWDADPNCDHKIIGVPGGGVRCIKCGGWHCE